MTYVKSRLGLLQRLFLLDRLPVTFVSRNSGVDLKELRLFSQQGQYVRRKEDLAGLVKGFIDPHHKVVVRFIIHDPTVV